ncbi:MAG: fasciclin domain-containing protein, partial [Cyanobacteria bacterium P01_C01_bin.121]
MSFGLLAASSLISALPAQASVLVKPAILREAPAQPADEPANQAAQPAPSQNIVGIASETLGFSTLVTAIEAANIGSVLSAEGPLTVFAPIDAAFAALPADTLDALLEPNNRDLLVKLLYNHVAYGDLTSDKLSMGEV